MLADQSRCESSSEFPANASLRGAVERNIGGAGSG